MKQHIMLNNSRLGNVPYKKTRQTLGLVATLENQAVNELRYPHRVASVSEFENSSSVEMCLDDKDSGDLLDGN